MKKLLWARLVPIGLWLAYWLYATRYAMMDDALIHLRYAANLHDLHSFTYNGNGLSYGTSSILYVIVLAILSAFWSSPLLPKAVSCLTYVVLVIFILFLERSCARRTGPSLVFLGLVLTSISPMAIMWLTDGMETGMVLLAVVLLAVATHKAMRVEPVSSSIYVVLVLLGTAVVLLRVELASLIFLATCAILAQRGLGARRGLAMIGHLMGSAPLFIGALLALLAVRLGFGSVLPDTALAKSGMPSLGPLGGSILAILSSFLLGVCAVTLAAVSALYLLLELLGRHGKRRMLLVWICINASFPMIVILACARGQLIQGVRYVLWPLFFTATWNALAWRTLELETKERSGEKRFAARLPWAFAVLFLCILPFDWHYAAYSMQGRANVFQAMRAADLGKYRNSVMIAGDIGFIGYFTGANVCDLKGLVNGRQAAMEGQDERMRRCINSDPKLLFLSEEQARAVGSHMPLDSRAVSQMFDFTKVNGTHRFYLWVPRLK